MKQSKQERAAIKNNTERIIKQAERFGTINASDVSFIIEQLKKTIKTKVNNETEKRN